MPYRGSARSQSGASRREARCGDGRVGFLRFERAWGWGCFGRVTRDPLAASASARTAAAIARTSAYRNGGGRNAAEWIPQFRGPAASVAIQTRATYRPASAASVHAPMRRQYTLSALRVPRGGVQWLKIRPTPTLSAPTGAGPCSEEAAGCPRTTTF